MKETKFKDTEVGRIPEDWEIKPIGEVADVKTGPFGSALHADDYVLDGTPIITVEHIGKIHIDTTNGVPRISEKDYMRLIVYSLKESDIVFSRVGSVDRCSHISKNENGWLFSGRLLRVRLKSDLDSLYLTYHLQTNEAKQRVLTVAVGLAMPSINTKILNGVLVAFPHDKSEQSRIATALSTIDNLISELGKLIEKKCAIKQGVMQQLLTGKKRLKGFNEPWVEKKLGECFSIGNGRDYKHLQEGNVPVYGTGGIMCYVNDFLYDGETVCIGRKGTIDTPMFHTGKIWTVDTLFYTHSFTMILPKFAFYLFTQINWNQLNEATGVPSLSKINIQVVKVNLPPLPEQQIIAAVLTSMDDELAAWEAKRNKYIAIKQGMMQQLLTGKIRLI